MEFERTGHRSAHRTDSSCGEPVGYRGLGFGAWDRAGFIRSTTKDTKVHEGNLWIYLIEIFVLFVSLVVNIESSWNLRGLATGPHTGRIRPAANQWATGVWDLGLGIAPGS